MPPGDHSRTGDSEDTPGLSYSRRKWLEILGIAGVGALAGCGSGGSDGEGTGTGGATDTGSPTPESTPTSVEGFGEETSTASPTAAPEVLPEVGGTYRDAISSQLTTLNAVYNTESTANGQIENAIHSSYGFKPGQVQFPKLFELTSDDSTVWVAKLRENLQWSDPYGQVTAEDFVYLIQEVHQTDWSGSAASTDWKRSDGSPIPVTQTGKFEWQIELEGPDPLFPKKPKTWGMRVVPKGLIEPYVQEQDAEGLKQDKDLINLNYTGNLGPYDLEKWERQSKLTFTRSENYFMRDLAADGDSDVPRAFEKAPYFDRLETQVIPEPSARVGALKTGEIDAVGLEPSQAANLKDTRGLYLNIAPQPFNRPLFYNQRANGWKPFRRRGVRQALGCAVNKNTYVKGVQRGFASPEYTWQPPWSPYYTKKVQNNVSKYGKAGGNLYGPKVTRNKLSEALSDTEYSYDGKTLVNGDGEQVELKLMYQSGQKTEENTAQFVKQEFAENAGIKININSVQGITFVRDYWRQQKPENSGELKWSKGSNNYGPRDKVTSKEPWDMGLIYGLNTYPMTPSTANVFFKKDGAFNAYGYYPSWDAQSTFKKMSEATTVEEYTKAVETYLIEVSKDQPMGMLSLGTEITGYRNSVQGPQEEFFNGWDFPTWTKSSQ